jgi:cation diffusion facilitator family transporter
MSQGHTHDLSQWRHRHRYEPSDPLAERATWRVVWITLAMMVIEIAAGWLFESMALLADGWHMGTHAAALGLAGLAYALARRWAADSRFAFGTWKIEVLGAFTSAVLLAVAALYVLLESLLRFYRPAAIRFDEALAVAVIGLLVNLFCAWLLGGHRHSAHAHDHAHEPAHEHDHAHAPARGADLNMESAYAHVLTDAFTSMLAIGALVGGRFAGWWWLDPAAGLLGAALIGRWSYRLILESAKALLDREMDNPLVATIRERLEADGDAKVADLHLWRIGPAEYACVATLVADRPLPADAYRERLRAWPELAHVSIEVNACPAG